MTALTGHEGHVVVVGASLAGWTAARTLRQEGFDGRLTIVGEEPHRPYERPPLSKALLTGGDRDAPPLPPAGDDLDAQWLLGRRATAVRPGERRVALDRGDVLCYDGLVLATGAVPRMLCNAQGERVHVLRSLDDALRLRDAFEWAAAVTVIGAGFIGAEVAAAARGRGLSVTLLEAADTPLARLLPPGVGEAVARVHRTRGVDVRCGVQVCAIEASGSVATVALAGGERVEADLVVVGIGARPATDWLLDSGLALDDGVLCDERCRASAPGVVAAGDVARWAHPIHGPIRIEHWDNAAAQGAAAARALLRGDAAEPYAPVPFVWSDQYEHTIHVAGVPRADDELRVLEGSPEDGPFAAVLVRDGRLSGVVALDSPRAFRRLRRQLGERSLEPAPAV